MISLLLVHQFPLPKLLRRHRLHSPLQEYGKMFYIYKNMGKCLGSTISYITFTHVIYAKGNSISKVPHDSYICVCLKMTYLHNSYQFSALSFYIKMLYQTVFILTSIMQESCSVNWIVWIQIFHRVVFVSTEWETAGVFSAHQHLL